MEAHLTTLSTEVCPDLTSIVGAKFELSAAFLEVASGSLPSPPHSGEIFSPSQQGSSATTSIERSSRMESFLKDTTDAKASESSQPAETVRSAEELLEHKASAQLVREIIQSSRERVLKEQLLKGVQLLPSDGSLQDTTDAKPGKSIDKEVKAASESSQSAETVQSAEELLEHKASAKLVREIIQSSRERVLKEQSLKGMQLLPSDGCLASSEGVKSDAQLSKDEQSPREAIQTPKEDIQLPKKEEKDMQSPKDAHVQSPTGVQSVQDVIQASEEPLSTEDAQETIQASGEQPPTLSSLANQALSQEDPKEQPPNEGSQSPVQISKDQEGVSPTEAVLSPKEDIQLSFKDVQLPKEDGQPSKEEQLPKEDAQSSKQEDVKPSKDEQFPREGDKLSSAEDVQLAEEQQSSEGVQSQSPEEDNQQS